MRVSGRPAGGGGRLVDNLWLPCPPPTAKVPPQRAPQAMRHGDRLRRGERSHTYGSAELITDFEARAAAEAAEDEAAAREDEELDVWTSSRRQM